VTIAAQAAADPVTQKPELSVVLTDNGPGLPKEALRLLFDPFALRSDTPLEYGLNLMACYFIVHHHGGRIEARSEPGQGTIFSLHLPLNAAAPTPSGDSTQVLQKVLGNQALWQKILTAE
jgi:signal transduction histidine kinase